MAFDTVVECRSDTNSTRGVKREYTLQVEIDEAWIEGGCGRNRACIEGGCRKNRAGIEGS